MTRQAAGVMWLPWSRRLTLFLIKHPTTDTNLSAPLEDISSSPHLPQLFPSPSPSTILFISALQLLMTHELELQPPAPNDASQLWCQCGVIRHDGDGEGGCWVLGRGGGLHSLQTVATLRMTCPVSSSSSKCAPSFVRAAAEAGTRCHHHPRLAIC